MKKTLSRILKEIGLEKLTIRQSLLFVWSSLAFCLMVCCNYEESAWYAMPVLVGNFAISAFFVKRYIPKSFWDSTDENDTEF